MVPTTTSLTDFSGETIWPLGQLRLLVTIWDAEHYTKAWMNIMIVRSPSPYNGIIGRPGIREIQAVPSTAHRMLKFPVNGKIVTIRSTIITPTECATIAATPKHPAKKAEARHKNFKVAIHPDFPDQEITIGGAVSTKARTELCTLFKGNLDIFAWQPFDTTGVPRSIVEHRLDIREGYSPVRQKKRGQAGPGVRQGNPSRGTKTGRGRNSARSILPRLVIQRCHGEGARWSYPSAATPLSVSWMPTKAIIKYRWSSKMRKRWLSIPVTGRRNVSRIHDQSGRDKTVPRQDEGRATAPIHTRKDVQSLNRKLASLNRFISKLVKKIFATIQNLEEVHQKNDFHLTPEAEQAFKQLKQHLAKLPMLVAPNPKKELIMYLSASYEAISAGLMSEKDTVQAPVLVKTLKEKSIQKKEMTTVVEEEGPTWMTPIIKYLRDETLPDNRNEASKVRIKARQYELLEGILYRRSFLKPWLRYVRPLQADYVIRKIHEGSCSMHAGPRSVVAKAMRSRHPQQPLTPITAPCPFYKWGIDTAGPFLEGLGKVKFLIVAMDYFTKWIEANAVATISGSQVKKFVWDNIVWYPHIAAACHELNSEGSGSAWKKYVNARVAGLFILVLLEYPNGKGVVRATSRGLDMAPHWLGVRAAPLMSPRQDETSEPLLYARRMDGPYRCKDATRGRNDDPVTSGCRSSMQMTMHEVVHEMVVGECHEPNYEGSGSAWKEYVNVRVGGLLLVLLEYPNGKGVVRVTSRGLDMAPHRLRVGAAPLMSPRQDETSEPLLYARRMAGPYRCKDATRGRNYDPVTGG
uniref:Reverse transcriptase domain-containing protein n=1 Tax=Tanacetum cinerariifolium TaxID=118510 RepID=A0A6L2LXX0_TANCI|nr:reverse transcriptase domain-containing protein [Tanacetum cinerariifolium]